MAVMWQRSTFAVFQLLVIFALAEANTFKNDGIGGGLWKQDVNNPIFRDMAEESLIKYMSDNDLNKHHKILEVKKVTTQIVAGIITRIDFNAKLDFSKIISCHSEIWDRPWLNQKEIDVTCVEKHDKDESGIGGGLWEQDINDPIFRDMAEESLIKYMRDNDLNKHHEILEVTKVTTQIVAGIITRIDFNAKLDFSKIISCHSEIWDRPWLNQKEIDIACVEKNNKEEGGIGGGLWEQDINDPIFRDMAEESLIKYMRDNDLNKHHEILEVTKVTTQIVAGIITRIDFNAKLDFSKILSCHSEIWDRPWLNKKEFDVTCVEKHDKDESGIGGGLWEQDINDPIFRDMAEESLIKYMRDNDLNKHHEILEVTKVTTQIVAGIITRIDFNAKLDFSKIISCHSEIWDRPWLNQKEIDIACVEKNNKEEGGIGGGLWEQDINDPIFRDMAEESLIKYMRDNDLNKHHEILELTKVTTQIVAGIITRIDFNAKLDFSKIISCHSEIWDRPWLNKKEFDVTCVEKHDKDESGIGGGLWEQDINDPIFRDMAEESLIKYMRDNDLNKHHEILEVKKVTTQIVAGIITRIDFNAKLDFSKILSCHSEIWDRPWLNKKEFDVTCVEKHDKDESGIGGGLWEQDINDPIFRDMAEESLIKYMRDNDLNKHHEIFEMTKVTTQIVAGIITRIDFNAKLDFSKIISCHSEIWDRPWLNQKEIDIACVEKNNKEEGGIGGGLWEQDINDPIFRDMAEESLIKYMRDNDLNKHHEILEVTKVTTQIVAGIITRIDFNAKLDFSKIISCHSEIWDRPWLNQKEIDIACVEKNNKEEGGIGGGLWEQDINDPIFRDMAEESLIKYMSDNDLNKHHEILEVKKVTTQIVAGIITRIDFNAKLDFSKIISCHSEIWDRPWLNKKEFDVTCVEKHDKDESGIGGGLWEQDINDPIFRDMAEESLIKYMRDNDLNKHHEILEVTKVTTQIVAGIITRIDFNAKLDFSKIISCHSEIWDRPWLNQKELDIACVEKNNKEEGGIGGGLWEQDINDPIFRDMAEESLLKYMRDNDLNKHHEILEVTKVTTQIVAGIITRIDFNAKLDFSKILSCHSEIWDRPWLNKKEFDVTCVEKHDKDESGIGGGLWEQDINDPIFRDMAEESLIKYMRDNDLNKHHEILEVTKVTTQIVAGIITRIDFNAKLDFSKILSCHSEIWDRPWLNKKEFDVTCVEKHDKDESGIGGGLWEQDINDPIFRDMAEESLIKYMRDNDLNKHHEILEVTKVTTQIVAGIITRIDFNAKLDFSKVISCHSKIWDRPWLNQKEIDVTCVEQDNIQKRQD